MPSIGPREKKIFFLLFLDEIVQQCALVVIINHQLYSNDIMFYFAYDLLWVRFLIMYNVFNSLIFYHLLYNLFFVLVL